MSDPNFSAIRARLRYETIDEFVDGYGRYISRGGMFVPMAPQKLKPVGTTVRFQFLLADGTSAMLGEGVVRQLKGVDGGSDNGLVGMLVKFTKLSPDSKELVDQVVEIKTQQKKTPVPVSSPSIPVRTKTPMPEATQSDQVEDTGVLAAAAADSLLAQTSDPEQDEASSSVPSTSHEETSEADPEEFLSAAAAPISEASEADEDDSPMGEFGEPDEKLEESSQELEEDSSPFSDAEGDYFSDTTTGDEEEEFDAFGDLDFSLSDEEPQDAPAQEAGDVDFGLDSEEEGDWLAEGLDDADDEPALEEADEPALEEASEEESASAPPTGPKAFKETQGGIRVMAFDDDDLDDLAAQEFADFASGSGDEVDDLFDNIFGGGDDGGLFGGDDDDGGDFFGEKEEAEQDLSQEEEEVPSEVGETPDLDEESEVAFELDSEAVLDEAPAVRSTPPPPSLPQAGEPALGESLSEASSEPEELLDLASQPSADAESEPAIDLREDDGDSSERIRSLLAMDEEEEEDGEMRLNLGGGSLPEQEEENEEEEEPDDMAFLLARAQQELEKKKKETVEDKEKDILDELLGDDDLPPPVAPPSAFDVPAASPPKKKKGFMSKFFGDKD